MTKKWQWILYVWHGWRCAVWQAEAIIRTGVRKDYAEYLGHWHNDRYQGLRHALFPPQPVDVDEMMRRMRG